MARRHGRRVRYLLPCREFCSVELFGLGRPRQSKRAALRVEGGGYKIKVARTHFPLMLDRRVAAFGGSKLRLLQVDICGHPVSRIVVGKVEDRQVERMEAGQCNELEGIPHRRQLALEF